MEVKIKPQNTAISNSFSQSAIRIAEREKKTDSVLDYGCGKLRNSKYLREQGFKNITVFDIPEQMQKIKDKLEGFNVLDTEKDIKYNVILNSYVLNVVLKNTRVEILNNIKKHMKPKARCYFEVRTSKDLEIIKKPVPYEDGILTNDRENTTFQKGFTAVELCTFLHENGFEVCEIIERPKSIIVIGELL